MLIATIAARAAFHRGRFREIHFAIVALDHLCDAIGAVLLQARGVFRKKAALAGQPPNASSVIMTSKRDMAPFSHTIEAMPRSDL